MQNSERLNKTRSEASLAFELFRWNLHISIEATYRNDPGDNHDDGENKTDDKHVSFAVERTLLVLKINLKLSAIDT